MEPKDKRGSLLKSFGEMAERVLDEQSRMAQRYFDEWGRAVQQGAPPARMDAQAQGQLVDQVGRYAEEVLRVGLNAANALLDINRQYSQQWMDQMFSPPRSGARSGSGAGSAGAEPAAEISASARAGELLTRSFTVENQYAQPMQVSLLVSAFVDDDSRACADAPRVDPAQFELAPGEKRAVQWSVQLDPSRFRAGGRYTASVLVRDRQPHEVRLRLQVQDGATPIRP